MSETTPETPAAYVRPTPDELRIYLELDDFTEPQKVRAALLLEQAEDLARDVVRPLPRSARTVVTSAAARAFINPSDSSAQQAGPFQLNASTGGLYLTRREERALQRAAGRGSAFTIDPTPAGAGRDWARRPLLNGPDNLPEGEVTLDDLASGAWP